MIASSGTLDSVENAADQAGAQFHAQRSAGGLYGLARAQAGGLLVDLDGSLIAVNLDDLANQTLLADAHHVEHIGVAHSLGDNQQARQLFLWCLCSCIFTCFFASYHCRK